MLQLARVLKNNWGERYDVARCACCACHAFLAGLLELLCGLASIACLGGSRQGVAFLPRCAADMLTHLPFLSDEHTAADLLFHAEKLAAAGPAKLHTLQLRLASLVAVTARRLAAAAAAGSERDEPAAVAAGSEDAQAAKALLGRLALAVVMQAAAGSCRLACLARCMQRWLLPRAWLRSWGCSACRTLGGWGL